PTPQVAPNPATAVAMRSTSTKTTIFLCTFPPSNRPLEPQRSRSSYFNHTVFAAETQRVGRVPGVQGLMGGTSR
ncbi:MAG: hypothetical protein ACOCWU_06490, partial [Spirochaetota bacterium]